MHMEVIVQMGQGISSLCCKNVSSQRCIRDAKACVLTLNEEVDVVDRLHADVSDMSDPWRRKLFSLPYPDSACYKSSDIHLRI